MKITRLDETDGFKQVEVADLAYFTIHTAKGRFSINESPGGGLTITESTHYHLAVAPNVGNGVTVYAIDRQELAQRPMPDTDPTTSL